MAPEVGWGTEGCGVQIFSDQFGGPGFGVKVLRITGLGVEALVGSKGLGLRFFSLHSVWV